MSSIRLDGKVIVITGATQGIGRALALDFAARGARVVGTARNPEPAAQMVEEARRLGGEFTFVQADAAVWNDCLRTADVVLEKYGRIDILINNAGISRPHARMDNIEESQWRAVMGSTLEGVIAMTRGVLPAMIRQKDGVIIHIASGAGVSGITNMGAYCMSKAAVIQHAKVVAIENMQNGVRANAIIVGPVETEAMKKSLLSQGKKIHGEDWTPESGKGAHMGKNNTIKPEDLASAVALLCSDDAREFNGGAIALDRGFSAGMYNSTVITMAAAGLLPL